MKLLELLVQEKVQWPDGALWAVQDADGDVKFNSCEVPPYIPNHFIGWWVNPVPGARFTGRRYTHLQLSDDWATKAVSKAEYDAAVAGAPDGRPYYVPIQMWYAELSHVIAAAAEGKVVQYLAADGNWYDGSGAFIHPNAYRIKPEEPKTIKVNGFDVPEPMREAPADDTKYYVPCVGARNWFDSYMWDGDDFDVRFLQRGVVHSTKEAAVAHAKAMLGIDPYTTEDADDEHA